MDIRQLIAEKLKSLREEHNMSQEELAYQLNLHPGSLSRIENGKVYITLPNLVKICDLFNIPLKDFFDINFVSEDSDRAKIISEINSDLKRKSQEHLLLIHSIIRAIK